MQRRFHIILNYRREDTSAYAGRLYDDLVDRFGGDHVFMDIDAIEPGVDFADVIERAVGSASVFLSVIGPGWLTAVDAKGARRLDKPELQRMTRAAIIEGDLDTAAQWLDLRLSVEDSYYRDNAGRL